MMQSVQRSFRVNEAVVAAELDNEMVLLNVETGIYFGLDALGTQIWSMLMADQNEDDIIQQLAAEYDVERTQLQTDVLEFLTLLRTKQLIYFMDS